MATKRRPPVIPEIAKAYQNDPRTVLAMQAMKAGTSGAPVATGKYAYADGIARVLQGAMGGYSDRKQQDKYGKEEAELLALRQQRGQDGLNGLAAPAAPPAPMAPGEPAAIPAPPPGGPPGAAMGAPAVAAALGAPPAPVAPPGPAMGLPAIPAPAAAGGGQVRRPFGPSSAAASTPSWNAPPQMEAVPDAPAPVAKPTMPGAEGPTRSKLLSAAYKMMADANPYESAGAQDTYVAGLQDQTKLDESAAERRQRLIDMSYEADNRVFTDAASQDRQNVHGERRDVQNRNYQSTEAFKDRGFRASESAADRSAAMARERFSAGAQAAAQERAQRFQQAQGDRDFEHQKVLQTMKTGADRKDYAAKYLQTKAGHAQITEQAKIIGATGTQLSVLTAFADKLPRTKTGGLLLGNAPGLVKWSNKDLQVLDGYTQQLVANNAKMLPGALSDKEGARLEAMGPSIKKARGANQENINFLRGVAVRQRAFAMGQLKALKAGEDIEFLDKWTAYTESVPVTSNMTYDQFIASVPKYDASGKRVK